ncbi:MAG: glycosyltransferase family 2 protein [Candidatus Lernaella stagnicola]|nr:glycosyltransferase family 2 protein [Candidatus Lernaella stagnicola]
MAVEITILVPLFDEQENLRPLHERLSAVLADVGRPYEILFIDDGSRDDSFSVLEQLHGEDREHVRVVRFRGNFGKSAALSAGFTEARGQIVFTMDADLQDDPEEIPAFLAKLDEGYDLVSGWKKVRHDPLGKTLPSKVFNWFTRVATGVPLHDFNCGFKCYRREVIEAIDVYGEMHRFLPALAAEYRFRVGEIPVKHHARHAGKSKYGIERFTRGAADLLTVLFLTRYFRRPAHLFGAAGFTFSGIGAAILLYLTALWFMGMRPIGNRPLLMFGVLFVIMGIQFISLGLLGEMFTRISAGSRPGYSIRQRLE